jgi:hypothetical protein
MTELPNNVGDLEFQKFERNSEDEVAVRITGGTINAEGKDISAVLVEYLARQEVLLSGIQDSLNKILNHNRYITGLACGANDFDDGY